MRGFQARQAILRAILNDLVAQNARNQNRVVYTVRRKASSVMHTRIQNQNNTFHIARDIDYAHWNRRDATKHYWWDRRERKSTVPEAYFLFLKSSASIFVLFSPNIMKKGSQYIISFPSTQSSFKQYEFQS